MDFLSRLDTEASYHQRFLGAIPQAELLATSCCSSASEHRVQAMWGMPRCQDGRERPKRPTHSLRHVKRRQYHLRVAQTNQRKRRLTGVNRPELASIHFQWDRGWLQGCNRVGPGQDVQIWPTSDRRAGEVSTFG